MSRARAKRPPLYRPVFHRDSLISHVRQFVFGFFPSRSDIYTPARGLLGRMPLASRLFRERVQPSAPLKVIVCPL